ncbi:C2 and GRAM domain-containing protein At1g03370 [Carica papaya]|uniref:C2 and GRAM domain-containing protein At1g03370 n=1 Tax=Carica papaya TaxID=3649 RepID=UPI000B8C93BC|nr:C2 and GRAM domain-containing protein At1g03370 [Carica papaya]
MKLQVRVIEARNLPAMDLNGFSDPYVRLQLGKNRSRTKVVKKCLNPTWGEEFSFRVEDLNEELVISVLDEDKYFNDDFVGQIKIPVSQVFDAENKSLGTVWYPLQPKNKKSKKDCGEILLNISFSQNNSFVDFSCNGDHAQSMGKLADVTLESSARFSNVTSTCLSPVRQEDSYSREERSCSQKTFAGRIVQMFNKNLDTLATTSAKGIETSELLEDTKPEVSDDRSEDQSSSCSFEELVKTMESKDSGSEIPSNLPGGVLLDQLYMITPSELNVLLFSPDSSFYASLADVQGTSELQMGPWKFENGGENLKRVLTYIKAATRLIKAVKGTEEQVYLKADGKAYAVLASVSTPDVMYGSTFKTELLYCITPGPELPSGEQCSHLVISWRMNFLQSTMMKGMIENGARQGLKDSYEQYANLLSQNVKKVDSKDIGLNKDQVLATLQAQPQSDWKLIAQYFANFTVVSTVFMGIYVLVHILLALPSTIQGLEFLGLDLPDSIGEFIVCGVLVLQAERVLMMISRFLQARRQKVQEICYLLKRTIMALWKARSLTPEQKVRIVEEESEAKLQTEESGSFLDLEDVSMSEVYSSSLPVPTSFCMELFNGGDLDRKAMERAGCHNYSCSPWESENSDVYGRQIYYRFDKRISRYRGEVTSTQQRSPLPDKNGWLVEEVMTLHGVPLDDYFNLQLRYQVEDLPSRSKGCHVRVFCGVAWLKSTKHQKRIAKNILSSLQDRLKVVFGVVEKEFANR